MKLRALALSILFVAGCGREGAVPTPSPSPKTSGPPKKKRPHIPKPKKPRDDIWHRIAQCESGGKWDYQGSTYSGGLQFMYSTWRKAGGTKFAPTAGEATAGEQILIAKSWLAKTSWAQWPRCSRVVGAR